MGAVSVPVTAGEEVGYWTHKSDGWHFYEPEPKKIKPRRKPEPIPMPVPTVPVPPPVEQGPAPLSAAWLRDNIQVYMDRAIDNPTPENVELVAYLQRLSLDKAERYAQAMVQVPMNNPALDEYARSPITAVQRDAAEDQMSAAKKYALAKLSQRVGLWYFFSSTCPYCARQDPILDRFQRKTGFNVLSISLDGGPHASGVPKPYVVDQGHAQQLGVMTTPTLVVADTVTNELHNLAAGLRTNSEIESRLLDLGKANGWITEAEYDEAVRGEPRMFITDALVDGPRLADDPAVLLQALKSASVNGGGSTPWIVAPQSEGTSQ